MEKKLSKEWMEHRNEARAAKIAKRVFVRMDPMQFKAGLRNSIEIVKTEKTFGPFSRRLRSFACSWPSQKSSSYAVQVIAGQ